MPSIVSRVIDCYVFRRRAAHAEFLVLLRSPNIRLGGTWQAVHGKVESGETAVAAALRELREETGLDPIHFWQLEHVNTFFSARDDAIHLCPGFAAEVAADALVTLSDEHTEFRWLDAEDATHLFMWPGQRQSVREIVEVILGSAAAEPHLRIALPGVQ